MGSLDVVTISTRINDVVCLLVVTSNNNRLDPMHHLILM